MVLFRYALRFVPVLISNASEFQQPYWPDESIILASLLPAWFYFK
jgi:hypothetical protein